MMFWYGGGWALWQAGLMWVGMLLFWGVLIWAVYALISSLTRRPPRTDDSDARRILDERLARGEIDVDEYRRLRDVLDFGDRRQATWTGSQR